MTSVATRHPAVPPVVDGAVFVGVITCSALLLPPALTGVVAVVGLVWLRLDQLLDHLAGSEPTWLTREAQRGINWMVTFVLALQVLALGAHAIIGREVLMYPIFLEVVVVVPLWLCVGVRIALSKHWLWLAGRWFVGAVLIVGGTALHLLAIQAVR